MTCSAFNVGGQSDCFDMAFWHLSHLGFQGAVRSVPFYTWKVIWIVKKNKVSFCTNTDQSYCVHKREPNALPWRCFFAKHASMIPCRPPFSNHFCWDFCTGWGRISCLITAKSKPSVFVLKSNIMRRHLCQVDHGLVPLEYLLQIHVNRSSFSGRWLSNATIGEKHWLSFLILKIEKKQNEEQKNSKSTWQTDLMNVCFYEGGLCCGIRF